MKWLLLGDSLIGDSLLQTPALRARKQKHPEDTIDYHCGNSRGTDTFFRGNPYLDQVQVNENGIDQFPLEAIVARDGSQYDRVVPMDAARAFHWAVNNRQTLAHGYGAMLDVQVDDLRYDYPYPAALDPGARAILESLGQGKPVVFIARHSASCASNDPKIRKANKCIANRIWVQVANWLLKEGFMPVALGGKADREDTRYHEWPGKLLYGLDYPCLASCLKQAAGTLSIDTGIRHLAAAVGGALYCVSAAIPLELIRCVPQNERHRLDEEFRQLPYINHHVIIAGARRILA